MSLKFLKLPDKFMNRIYGKQTNPLQKMIIFRNPVALKISDCFRVA